MEDRRRGRRHGVDPPRGDRRAGDRCEARLGPGRLAGLLVLASALLAAGCSTSGSTSEAGSLPDEPATVARVNDGDTLTTTAGDKVRLVQIDAPELYGDCYGTSSLTALKLLTPKGTLITLVGDPVLDATDRYGRKLRYVLVNGLNVNVALVRGGAASPYFFHNEKGHYAKALLAAVAKARAGRLGYWGACPKAKLNTGLGSITGPG